MISVKNWRKTGLFLSFLSVSVAAVTAPAMAQTFVLPGSADVGRVDDRAQLAVPDAEQLKPSDRGTRVFPSATVPEESRKVTVTLTAINIEGMTAFKPSDMADITSPYLNHEITLDQLWVIAEKVTLRYREKGYFLSRAIVPAQEVDGGVARIQVVEGYIADVVCEEEICQRNIVREWFSRLKSYKPVRLEQSENVLLQLNDLPGVNLRAVLEPMTGEGDGAVRMRLLSGEQKKVSGTFSLDNYGSKFLGPWEGTAQIQADLLPLQRTTLTGLSTLPWDELKYGGIKHEAAVYPGGTVEVYASKAASEPGYTLESRDIESESVTIGGAINHQFLHLRDEVFGSRLAFEARNTDSDILGTPLTRDRVRAVRAGVNYSVLDSWNGANTVDATLSQGLGVFGANSENELNLSRAAAKPYFTAFEATVSRLQPVTRQWSVLAAATGQVSSSPLYSSEEFGYGGQAFGRAYDESEITGDSGVAAKVELQYTGITAWKGIQPIPYGFYDVGTVWNRDIDQDYEVSAASAGFGVKVLSDKGASANLGVAFPLTKDIDTPITGNGRNPRYLMQVNYGF